MYELTNTSLPNGLIPGTHGFATVAMTKGLPDSLRTRLESYCAYSHRTSAHDATYFRENPVNWFHVVLPQGEHVAGRVAPADFDYTGRTNRLARLLVFPKGEMPAIGGADVLRKEFAQLTAPWSGEARWLEDDKLTAGRLRREIPAVREDAPTWCAMFGGEEGLRLAEGFARQLAKNVTGGGNAIYFKTSAARDADGTKLLALFAELVNLLPVANRQRVTFSTFPSALPQGTVCHLRGVYDSDRAFEAASASQPWVDCERGIVHNAAMLPPEERRRTVDVERETIVAVPARTIPPGRSAGTAKRPAVVLSNKNDGTKSLFIGIIIVVILLVSGAVGLVSGAVGTGIYMWRESERKNLEEQAKLERQAEQDKQETGNADHENETSELVKAEAERRIAEEYERKRQQAIKDAAAEVAAKTVKAKAEERSRENEKRERERIERERKAALEKAAKEDQERQRQAVAFTEAKKIEILDGESIQLKYNGEQGRMTNGSLKVFWYGKDGTLTNATAGFTRNRTTKAYRFTPDPKKLAEDTSGAFLIWLDPKKEVAYWDWSPLEKKEPAAWFAGTNEVDLARLCFGVRSEIISIWEKHFAATRFTVEISGNDEKLKLVQFTISDTQFGLEKLVAEDYKKRKDAAKNNAENVVKQLNEYKEQKKKLDDAKKEYYKLRKEVDDAQAEIKKNNEAVPNKKDKDAEKKAKNDKRDKEQEIDNLWKERFKEIRSFWGVSLKFDNHKIEGLDNLSREFDKKIKECEGKEKENKKIIVSVKDDIRKGLREARFRIVKVKGVGQ